MLRYKRRKQAQIVGQQMVEQVAAWNDPHQIPLFRTVLDEFLVQCAKLLGAAGRTPGKEVFARHLAQELVLEVQLKHDRTAAVQLVAGVFGGGNVLQRENVLLNQDHHTTNNTSTYREK